MDKKVTIESEELAGLLYECCVEFDISGTGNARKELINYIDERLNELVDALDKIVKLDADAHPGLATWYEARCKADKEAQALVKKYRGE